jgi:O-6-methylguanine DNA methyltransferase
VRAQTAAICSRANINAAPSAIPAGTTSGYGALATRIGKPGGARAVGLANGLNPIGIVVPCHRVIGASGALTGYAGGVERKRWLLAHEGVLGQLV